MLTKYALAAVIVLCLTVLGFTLLVGPGCLRHRKGT